MAQRQFAIMDNDKDTVTNHLVSRDFFYDSEDTVYTFDEFSLLDDSGLKCKPRLIYASSKYWFEMEFIITKGPLPYQYEISLYHFNRKNKFRFIDAEYLGAIKENRRVKLKLATENIDAFEWIDGKAYLIHVIDEYVKLCSKISRKDGPLIWQHKPALLLDTQVTDCSLLFENNALSNFEIIVQKKEFHVHKEILAAKSPVFLAMFDSEMKEKKENRLVIEDIVPDVFYELLRYIYTNAVNDLETNAENLFIAADKYDIKKLKLLCADELIRSLNVENAMHVLILSDKYNANKLKKQTINFFKTHIKLIFETEGYRVFCQSHPQLRLFSDIFEACI